MLLADYEAFIKCQERVDQLYSVIIQFNWIYKNSICLSFFLNW